MKKEQKKGFTIVELLIVIAVIAVLAAVLVPVMITLIDDANESADKQAVRNMNVALASAETTQEIDSVQDALAALSDAGLDANGYQALESGYKFVWCSSINRVLYVEKSTNTVAYPDEYTDIEYEYGTWYTLTGQVAGDDSWIASAETVTSYTTSTGTAIEGSYTKYSVASEEQLVSIADDLRSGDLDDEDIIIVLDGDTTYDVHGDDGAEWVSIPTFGGIFDGSGATITGIRMTDNTQDCETMFTSTTANDYKTYGFISVFTGEYFGNVTLEVEVDTPGEVDTTNHTVAGAFGAITAMEEGEDIVVESVTVSGSIRGAYRVGGIAGYIGGTSSTTKMKGSVTIKDCVNEADIESYLCVSSYGTAGGILATSNKMDSTAEIVIESCTNTGSVYGQLAGGIMSVTWGASTGNGSIYVRGNLNSGAISAYHREEVDGVDVSSYTSTNGTKITLDTGELVEGVAGQTLAAGIAAHFPTSSAQAQVYVYGNVNTGNITADHFKATATSNAVWAVAVASPYRDYVVTGSDSYVAGYTVAAQLLSDETTFASTLTGFSYSDGTITWTYDGASSDYCNYSTGTLSSTGNKTYYSDGGMTTDYTAQSSST